MTQRPCKKLIEVALPLEGINREAAREKSIRHGHPSTLHLWWARRPLAACRAVLFASIVDDPSSHPEKFPTEEDQDRERQRLFRIIEELVKWENSNNERVLEAAREEIRKATGGNPPPVLDPFCGGGSIPLEAQRLGLEAHASDLNPVAVLITKALIEIPPKFAGKPPVNPEARKKLAHSGPWKGAQGLAEDVRYYGQWMRNEAKKRIGHLYPKVKLPKEQGSGEATVIAWLWARTVKCPNPVCGAEMPLLTSFILSSKKGNETYLVPATRDGKVSFSISSKPPRRFPDPKKGLKRGMSGIFECVFCGSVTTRDYVASEGKAQRLGVVATAVVVQASRGRIYLPVDSEAASTPNLPEVDARGLTAELSPNPRDVWCRNFGLETPAELFTPRQLVAMTTLDDLVSRARDRVLTDALAVGVADDGKRLEGGGTGPLAYADAVSTYLSLGVSKLADYSSSLVLWSPGRDQAKSTFARQALPMVWDFAEVNPFAGAAGDLDITLKSLTEALEALPARGEAAVKQLDATSAPFAKVSLVATDPPYYDNIGYSDLADYFYVWLRRSAGDIYPSLFSTLLTPKVEELVATPYRFAGDETAAEKHFESGLSAAFERLRLVADQRFPMTVYYAFKQAEQTDEGDREGVGIASTGWETMLEALLGSGLSVCGTWPMRTERGARSVSIGTNALASSVVLACRRRDAKASLATRREFLAALNDGLPIAIAQLRHSNIAPVDLAQAAIGPGMAVFSDYSKVVEADGRPMGVRTALGLINQVLDEVLAQQEGDFDSDTRWALAWYEQYDHEEGAFGVAETLSKAKNTSVRGLEEAGILKSKSGKVRLLRREELDGDWNPKTDRRLTLWEIAQHLVRKHESEGEAAAAELLREVGGGMGEVAKDLAYRLYQICDRKGWSSEAQPYNALVVAWPEISRLANAEPAPAPVGDLFE